MIAQATPVSLVRETHKGFTRKTCELDRELLDGLSARGFQHDYGADGTGWQFKYLTRGGGYYFNVGASDMVVDGTIGLEQFAEIDTFTAKGARMTDGREIPADLVVLATGYRPQEELVARLFGQDTADRVGKIWGFETPEAQELSQHVLPHWPARAVVHCREPRAMPDLLEIPGTADQGVRGRPDMDSLNEQDELTPLYLVAGPIRKPFWSNVPKEFRCSACGNVLPSWEPTFRPDRTVNPRSPVQIDEFLQIIISPTELPFFRREFWSLRQFF